MTQPVTVSGNDQLAISRKALTDAGTDARYLIENRRVVSSLVTVDIIARQLFLLVRHGLESELNSGWEIENPQLVLQTLGLSAQEKAISDQVDPVRIREDILTVVLPVVDIFCQMKAENDKQQSSIVPGDSHNQSA